MPIAHAGQDVIIDFQGTGRSFKKKKLMRSILKKILFNNRILRTIYLVRSDNLVSNTFLNVTEFRSRYSGMRGRRVEGVKIPKDTPDETDGASRVEYSPPSEIGDDERAQRIGQSDADTEP